MISGRSFETWWDSRPVHQKVIAIFSISTFFFACMIACGKGVSHLPVVEILFFRNSVAWVIVSVMIVGATRQEELKTKRIGDHFLRGLFGLASMACIFSSYRYLPMAEATAIGHAQPIFLAILSVIFLREPAYLHRWAGVAFGFFGVVVMLNPSAAGIDSGSLLALGGAFLAAIAMVMVRRLGSTETSAAVVFFFMGWGTLVSGTLLPFFWQSPTAGELTLLIGTGAFGAFGQLLMVEGYRIAEASLVASLNYLQLVWSALLGLVIWHEVPRISVIAGVAIVMASQILMVRAEGRMRRRSSS